MNPACSSFTLPHWSTSAIRAHSRPHFPPDDEDDPAHLPVEPDQGQQPPEGVPDPSGGDLPTPAA